MKIFCFAASGYDGRLVEVEVDIRRGIPGLEIVGLPDNAVRESRDRVRVAIRNSGFTFPADRVLVNLSPADVRKEGAGFDLPIALALLIASRQTPAAVEENILVVGELQLSGRIRGVRGILPAVAAGVDARIARFLVPAENANEARALERGLVSSAETLVGAVETIWTPAAADLRGEGDDGETADIHRIEGTDNYGSEGDYGDLRGHEALKRALVIAAAGRHNLLLFGPPGTGKTMSVKLLPGILPPLTRSKSVAVTRIHSLAGTLPPGSGLIHSPPFRMPHHSASAEGLVGGGRSIRPGEVTLAHAGILLLDEAPEFGKHLLQCLREPIESGRVDIARAGTSSWYPADFQLVMTANSCPCGNLGRDDGICVCTRYEIQKYWKKLGGALLDRIDMRVPVRPVTASALLGVKTSGSAELRRMVCGARSMQERRIPGRQQELNGKLKAGEIQDACRLTETAVRDFADAARSMMLSSRACHSVLKTARTIADIDENSDVLLPHIYEAIQQRRYGDNDFFWS